MFKISPTDKISVVLAANVATNPLECMAGYRDRNSTGPVGRNIISTNNQTAIELVLPPPITTTERTVEWLMVYNRDTSPATVTLRFYVSENTFYVLRKVTLAPDELLEYLPATGFRVLESSGAPKTAMLSGGATGIQTKSITADVTSNAGANVLADVTGLSFPVVAGQRYWFRFVIPYTAAALTTGSRWTISGPASPTELRYRSEYGLTLTTGTVNEGLAAYDAPAASNASSAALASNLAVIEGFITPSATGNVIARFASEIAASAIVAKRGAMVQYLAVG